MKGQDKTPEKQLNKVEIGNLTENEFRIMIIKMIQDHPEFWKKNGEDARNVYQKPRTTKEQTEMNNTLEGINRIIEAEEQISDLEDRMVEITATK